MATSVCSFSICLSFSFFFSPFLLPPPLSHRRLWTNIDGNWDKYQLGGNGHALAHHDATGHPFCVKIGTITPKGEADIYCYACDNDVKDLELEAHLAHFGISLSAQSKTEKTIAEMSLEQNLRANLFRFGMPSFDVNHLSEHILTCPPLTTSFSLFSFLFSLFLLSSSKENGKVMKSMFGPGLTGINNIGNSCYLASVLQCVAAIPAFRERYSPGPCFFLEGSKEIKGRA